MALFACILTGRASAEDWGAYALIPVSAPGMALEVVDAGTNAGALISIGRASGKSNQKWFLVPKGNDLYAIRPAYSDTMVMSVANGGAQNGTAIVLETDRGQPWQLWALKKNENGSYCLVPRHAPDKGLDDFGGHREPGSRQDLWTNAPGDPHLQWLVKPLAGTLTAGVYGGERGANDYIAPDIKPEAILPGQIKSAPFAHSAIFPGTVRQVTVFIPAQYDGSRPACVYVRTDGYNPIEKSLLERLIATKEMPVTIGIFVTPGDLPPLIRNTLGRRNRDLEYDGMGDKNARFLLEEIFPFVTREFGLKLSDSGNDRCIAGGSSGGIAAFNAAWEWPDAFSRVYANSGSFVAFRGGHEFPTLVRKTEAKPIRAYLTTGTNDMENAAGDWFLLDQEMDKALRFSGYDYFFRIINGGHVAGYYDYYQEAMSYLWKGWPQPVRAGPSAPRVRDVLLPDQSWQPVDWQSRNGQAEPSGTKPSSTRMGTAAHDLRGAACNANGEVFFIDAAANKVYRMDLDGHVREFLADAGQANSLNFGAQGELYAVSSATGKIMRYEASGRGSLVADGIYGQYVLATPGGGLFVTSNRTGEKSGRGASLKRVRGSASDQEDSAIGEVWFVKNGKKTRVASGLKCATGLAYRPDQWLLAVAEGHSRWAMSYQINPDGTLTQGERFFWLHVADGEDDAGTEAVCYAREGQILLATRMGIQICADDGPTQVILPMPDRSRVMSVCLGGRERDTLYAFCGDKIWMRRVKIHGIGAFTPWTRVNGTPL
ncbi:MAG TPA: RICIN domain-containing protein [Chthonomonadaceae bacterium]|nr:RICIN domain-containing protein [Chthonomonadaceae bacterium]